MLLEDLKIPNHVAIIMDGNGRWAKSKGLNRIEGHKAGVKTVSQIVEAATKLGIKYLTLYSFSSENWNRPEAEVGGLMDLFRLNLESQYEVMMQNGIRLHAIGDLKKLPFAVRKSLEYVINKTSSNKNLNLVLAISYGSRDEILEAVRSTCLDVQSGKIKVEDISHEYFRHNFWSSNIPDPDLLIRTSGELRVSNFLLWQIAYTEIIVLDQYWPDFNEDSLQNCLIEYSKREIRMGKTSEQLTA